jgi:hypothetical protein
LRRDAGKLSPERLQKKWLIIIANAQKQTTSKTNQTSFAALHQFDIADFDQPLSASTPLSQNA